MRSSIEMPDFAQMRESQLNPMDFGPLLSVRVDLHWGTFYKSDINGL